MEELTMNETNVEQLNQDLMEDQNTCEEAVYDQTSEPESKSGKEALVGLLAFGAGVAIKTGFDKLKGKFVDEETQKQKKEARKAKRQEKKRAKLQKQIEKDTKKLGAIDTEFSEIEESETNDKEAK